MGCVTRMTAGEREGVGDRNLLTQICLWSDYLRTFRDCLYQGKVASAMPPHNTT